MPFIDLRASAAKAPDSEVDSGLANDQGEMELPLMSKDESLTQQLSNDPFAVDAKRVNDDGAGGSGTGPSREPEALATPPCEFTATLSDNFVPGQAFVVQGPHGPIKVEPPADATPGMTLRYRLAPRPDFKVQVPPDMKPGSEVKFQRADGIEVSVRVPEGLGPGDMFEVSPPALMVRVPDGVAPVDFVIFRSCIGRTSPGEAEWYRAPVPTGLEPGKYFTARLPQPSPNSPSRGKGSPRKPKWMQSWAQGSKRGSGPLQLLRKAFMEEAPQPQFIE